MLEIVSEIELEKAVDILEKLRATGSYKEDVSNALRIAVMNMQRNIGVAPYQSKEPRYGMGYEYYDYYCPTCNHFLTTEVCGNDFVISESVTRCDRCDQKVNWKKFKLVNHRKKNEMAPGVKINEL